MINMGIYYTCNKKMDFKLGFKPNIVNKPKNVKMFTGYR